MIDDSDFSWLRRPQPAISPPENRRVVGAAAPTADGIAPRGRKGRTVDGGIFTRRPVAGRGAATFPEARLVTTDEGQTCQSAAKNRRRPTTRRGTTWQNSARCCLSTLVPNWQLSLVRSATGYGGEGGGVFKTLWNWVNGRPGLPEFKDDELLTRRRAALSDSARRQAAQLRADQEAGKSTVGPWAPATGSSRRLARPSKVLSMVWRDGTGTRP